MTTVYSAVLFGGRTGKAVTASSVTGYVTLVNHGLRSGKSIAFASGTLPTVSGEALGVSTLYYVKYIDGSNFELYRDLALTDKIVFTDNGSSLVVVAGMWLSMSAEGRLRYGPIGAERVYDSINSAIVAVSASSSTTEDNVVEVLMAFDDITTNSSYTNAGRSLRITSMVNGLPTEAFHWGIPGSGFTVTSTDANGAISLDSFYITVEFLEFCRNSVGVGTSGVVDLMAAKCTFRGNIVRNTGAASCYGILVAQASDVYNNIVMAGLDTTYGIGIYINANIQGVLLANNLVTKCWKGFVCASGVGLLAYNNLAVGNTVNWGAGPNAATSKMTGNIGGVDDARTFVRTSGSTLACSSAPNFVANQPVMLSTTGALPSVSGVPLSAEKLYWVASVSGSNVTLKTTRGGATPMTYSSGGAGVHSITSVWETFTYPSAFIDFTDPSLVFMDWNALDFRPAGYGTATPGSQAKMVDAAREPPQFTLLNDILLKERPGYNDGSPEYSDVGPFEFDFGYGPRPASHVLTLGNVVVGSRIVIRNQAKTVVHHDAIAASSTVVITVQVYGDARDYWLVDIRKASATPFYQRYKTLMTATAGASSLYINQLPDER